MKNQFLIIISLIGVFLSAQVAIEKESVDGDGLLDFGSINKGIVLPSTNVITNPTAGAITFNKNKELVEYFDGQDWNSLTIKGLNTITPPALPMEEAKGVIIGAETSAVDGVLILESQNKALILPKASSPHINMLSPEAGTICYDTASKTVAIFNGSAWTFWK